MQEFNNTAIDESANTDCLYFNECYLQLRNNGCCFSKCKDFHPQMHKESNRSGMTKEEALVKVRGYLTDYLPLENADEIDEIIKTLEQQSSKDCIKREPIQKAIKDMLGWINSGNRGNADYFIVDQIEEIIAELDIDNLPPAIPEPFINKPCVSEGICHEDKIQVLNKIRAELIQSIQNGTLKIESGNEKLFSIIDKYKLESEVNRNDNKK